MFGLARDIGEIGSIGRMPRVTLADAAAIAAAAAAAISATERPCGWAASHSGDGCRCRWRVQQRRRADGGRSVCCAAVEVLLAVRGGGRNCGRSVVRPSELERVGQVPPEAASPLRRWSPQRRRQRLQQPHPLTDAGAVLGVAASEGLCCVQAVLAAAAGFAAAGGWARWRRLLPAADGVLPATGGMGAFCCLAWPDAAGCWRRLRGGTSARVPTARLRE